MVEVDVSYSQIAAFHADLAEPFSDWSEEHVAQGFAWRPGSVSFATLDDGGVLRVSTTSKPFDDSRSTATRVIQVPFDVPERGSVELASIGASATTLELRPGSYELTFEHGIDEKGMWATFHFVSASKPVLAKVLRADGGLSPPDALVMSAEPA
jgi:hypothetical protein